MNYHFIAIGGSAMHNLAINLKQLGHNVTGSDDQIYEPSYSKLKKHNLLPKQLGWDSEKVNSNIDGIILGMHAKKNNIELQKAIELKIKIYSYPEFIYEHSKYKKRIVIAGSHGKTTITSMVMYVLKSLQFDFDYMVGAQIENFDTMIQLNDKNSIIILEGDEYLSSPIDLKSKFLWYKPHLAVISGIAWDHINVFPTFENYVQQFKTFIEQIKDTCFYFKNDPNLKFLVEQSNTKVNFIPYESLPYEIINNKTYISYDNVKYELKIFGEHNLQNMAAALHILEKIGVSKKQFFESIKNFKGASNRLEKIFSNDNTIIYKDFAHSPSKIKATINAIKKQYYDKKIIACMQLNTFSSLYKDFLCEYKNVMNEVNSAIVYFNPTHVKNKGFAPLTGDFLKKSFNRNDLIIETTPNNLLKRLQSLSYDSTVLLMMSSGNFDSINMETLHKKLNLF